MGNCYDLSPFVATKVFSGAGGSSAATFLNGKLTPPRAPQGTEFIPPLEESSTAGV